MIAGFDAWTSPDNQNRFFGLRRVRYLFRDKYRGYVLRVVLHPDPCQVLAGGSGENVANGLFEAYLTAPVSEVFDPFLVTVSVFLLLEAEFLEYCLWEIVRYARRSYFLPGRFASLYLNFFTSSSRSFDNGSNL